MTLRNVVPTQHAAPRNSIDVAHLDVKTRDLLRRLFPAFARIALFVVYTWFGSIKLLGMSPATPLAEALARHTIGPDYFEISFALMAVYECVIGVLFLIPAATRSVIPLLLVHMAIVCSPLALVPELAWTAPLVPSLEGQYIIKNLVIIALAIGLAAQIPPISRRRASDEHYFGTVDSSAQ
jgi:uncharacterized membrane protein YkgB